MENVPDHLQYTAQHEWLNIDGDIATVGITAFAADALGDVVYVDLPGVGTIVSAGESCGEIESTKSVSDLFAPADGEVVELNEAVMEDPGALNTDPFGDGWLFHIRLSSAPDLLSAAEYQRLVGDE
jgi:glycine cleavage system H protein